MKAIKLPFIIFNITMPLVDFLPCINEQIQLFKGVMKLNKHKKDFQN